LKKIIYVNASGEELTLTNSFPFLLQKFSESENVNIYTSKGMNQDGLTYLGNTLELKDITLEFTISGESEAELISYQDKIRKTLNPKLGEGYLLYNDDIKERKIKCILNKLPVFSKINGTHGQNGKVSSGLISLTAHNPFWTDLLESKEEIALWIGDFEFLLELVSGGIEVGHRAPSLIVNAFNTGDVECGMRIEFKALATLSTPSLLNVNTGEFIRINRGMVVGEVISVSTYFGNKNITSTLDGVKTNIVNDIYLESTFLQLDIGDNLFRYDALSGLDNLEVSIYYMPMYLGV
jgi:hypothetical protein